MNKQENDKSGGSVNIDDVNAQNEQDKQELAAQASEKQKEENDDQTQEEIRKRHQTQDQQRAGVDPKNEGKGYVAPKPDIPSARNAARNHEGPLTSASPKTDI